MVVDNAGLDVVPYLQGGTNPTAGFYMYQQLRRLQTVLDAGPRDKRIG